MHNCPSCGSDNIHIMGEFDAPELEFKGNVLTALKVDSGVGSMRIDAKCNECGTDLIPTKTGYRQR